MSKNVNMSALSVASPMEMRGHRCHEEVITFQIVRMLADSGT